MYCTLHWIYSCEGLSLLFILFLINEESISNFGIFHLTDTLHTLPYINRSGCFPSFPCHRPFCFAAGCPPTVITKPPNNSLRTVCNLRQLRILSQYYFLLEAILKSSIQTTLEIASIERFTLFREYIL